MAKPEWGEKHRCSACSKPFYDMQRKPIVCPACGAEHIPEKLLKPRKAAETPTKASPKAKVVVDGDGEESSSSLLLDDDAILKEDDVDLPDDDEDDDLSDVVAHPTKEEDL